MIGIGTIGRAAESGGGSTTNQNGQYIAFDMYDTTTSPSTRTLYYSDNFGATFKTKDTPLPTTGPTSIYINYLGEIMLVYSTSLYYAATPTSSWVLIENQHTTTSRCDVSWDFNTIVYARTNYKSIYISRNKGVSFTTLNLSGTPTTPYDIMEIKISGDGSKAYVFYRESPYDGTKAKVCLVNLTTGSVISYKVFRAPSLNYTNYYGDYCIINAYNAGVYSKTGILYNNNRTFFTSLSGYTFIGENGWGVEYFANNYDLRFFSIPSPYSTIKTYNSGSIIQTPGSGSINTPGVVGDYFYYSQITSGVIYLYKLDRNVGSSPILIKSITGPSATNTKSTIMAVSRVPLTLL